MASSNEALVARRRAALAAKKGAVPTVEPAEVPAVNPPIQPLRPPESEASVPVTDDDGDDAPVVAPITPPSRPAFRKALAVNAPDPTRTLEQSDLVMPKLKISQAMSKVNAEDIVRQGNYYHSTLNDNLGKKIWVVPVDMRKSRGRFVQGQGILCRSFDMIQGEGDPGLLCEGTIEEQQELPAKHRGCPLRLWGDRDANGRSTPPSCGISYNYPLLVLDPDNPTNGLTRRALFSVRGTATPIARAINSIVTENDLRWHETVLELGLESKTNVKGTFYVPTVKFIGLTEDIAPKVLERAKIFAGQVNADSIRATIEDDGEE